MVIAADGSSSPTTLVANGDGVRSPAWSPDGTRIAFSSDWGVRDNGLDIFVAGLSGGAIMSLTQSRPSPSHRVMPMFDRPAWSPDGRNLAAVGCPADYETCETSWIYLIGVDAPGLRPLAVGRALSRVTWSPDGKTLAYGSGGAIRWIRADGSDRGVLVNGGHSPAWRPVP